MASAAHRCTPGTYTELSEGGVVAVAAAAVAVVVAAVVAAAVVVPTQQLNLKEAPAGGATRAPPARMANSRHCRGCRW
jgi:hypothetical protein